MTLTVQLISCSTDAEGGGGSSRVGSRSLRPSSNVRIAIIDTIAAGVGERVGDDRVAVGHRLGRGLERRRVRGAAGEQPGPVGGREIERPRHQRAQPGQRSDQRRGDRDRERAATSQAGDERRTRRQADRVGEQHEAELAEQSEAIGRTDRVVGRADGEADEQRRRRPERDPLDADAADTGADADDEEDEQDRVVHQEVRHRRDSRPGGSSTTGACACTPTADHRRSSENSSGST